MGPSDDWSFGAGIGSEGLLLGKVRLRYRLGWAHPARTVPGTHLLGYVYLYGGKMLGEEIVKVGYANLMTHPPNVKYQERFLKAHQEAKDKGKGLWR